MRAVQLALFVILIQVGMGIVTVSGLFPGTYYESSLTGIEMPENPSAMVEAEQTQASISVFNTIMNAFTWGWIKTFFTPWYYLDAGLKLLIDYIIIFLNLVSGIIIGIALLEFVRNRAKIL